VAISISCRRWTRATASCCRQRRRIDVQQLQENKMHPFELSAFALRRSAIPRKEEQEKRKQRSELFIEPLSLCDSAKRRRWFGTVLFVDFVGRSASVRHCARCDDWRPVQPRALNRLSVVSTSALCNTPTSSHNRRLRVPTTMLTDGTADNVPHLPLLAAAATETQRPSTSEV